MDPISLLAGFDVQKIHHDASRLLAQVGLEVLDEPVRQRLRQSGAASWSGDRLRLDEQTIQRYVEELRTKLRGGQAAPRPRSQRSGVFCSGLPNFYIKPGADQMTPFSSEDVITYTKLVDALRDDQAVTGTCPGTPQDVPPRMQWLRKFYLGACYSRSGGNFPGIGGDMEALEFLAEMAEIMGKGTAGFCVETSSPLGFGGNSLQIALHFQPRLREIWLDPMPVMGVSAPLDWHAGWVQSVAENIGSYAVLRLLGFEHVYPTFRLFPGSMRSLLLLFGSPDYFFILLMRAQIRAFYGLGLGGAETLHTMAVLPDAQASAEKLAQTVFAAQIGHRQFPGGGMLALDEVFSPEQLMIDLEIRDYADRVAQGAQVEITDPVKLIEEGMAEHNFAAAPYTLDHWREKSWLPRLFQHSSRAQWAASPRYVRADAWAAAQEYIRKHDYELDAARRRDLDQVMQKAEAVLS